MTQLVFVTASSNLHYIW